MHLRDRRGVRDQGQPRAVRQRAVHDGARRCGWCRWAWYRAVGVSHRWRRLRAPRWAEPAVAVGDPVGSPDAYPDVLALQLGHQLRCRRTSLGQDDGAGRPVGQARVEVAAQLGTQRHIDHNRDHDQQ
ncbi:MAG: hypothetical protein WCC65_12675 [Pseudonocardiaceae bacterium]